MKRALRNTETAMFIKSDGGETDTLHSARSFLSYDEAVAFCKTHRLATVELVVRTDDQSEYTVSVPAKYVMPDEDDDTVVSGIQSSVEAVEEPAPHWSVLPEPASDAGVACCEPQVGFATQACGVEVEADECGLQGTCHECAVEAEPVIAAVDESEVAISRYANFDLAAHAPEFHFSPPEKCDVCGVKLSDRWFFVDGRMSESAEWRDMCSQCFFIKGARIGPGKGQLYQRQPVGRWLLVGGFARPE